VICLNTSILLKKKVLNIWIFLGKNETSSTIPNSDENELDDLNLSNAYSPEDGLKVPSLKILIPNTNADMKSNLKNDNHIAAQLYHM